MDINLNESKRTRSSFLTLILGFAGMLFAVGGAALFFANQVQMDSTSIWPLPALALIDWALIGFLGFFSAFFAARTSLDYWPKAAWVAAGALLPLIILGAFSIGFSVLLSLPFFLVSAILISAQKRTPWLNSLAFFMLGAAGNLGLFFIFMVLAGTI